MPSLYEINAALQDLLERGWGVDCINLETGEVLPEKAAAKIEALGLERDTKIEHIACYIKDLEGDTTKLKVEIDNLGKRKKSMESKAEYLKGYLDSSMQESGLEKFETPRCKLSYRASEALHILDEPKLRRRLARLKKAEREKYLKVERPKICKTELKNAIKAGKSFTGCVLRKKQNLQIK